MRRASVAPCLAACVVVASCAVVASCSLDFVAPGPGSPVAQLTLRLDLGFLQGDSLRINAALDPGVGADGSTSRVPDPRLTVLGASLSPDSTTLDERLVLHWGAISPHRFHGRVSLWSSRYPRCPGATFRPL